MRQLGTEIGDHTQLIVGVMLAAQAHLRSHPRVSAIRTHDQLAVQRLSGG